MSSENYFKKENMDIYLKELAKEFRKQNGKSVPAEIILIGGAAVLINYGFRDITYDMDAIIEASSSMKDAINTVGDKYGLPKGWLNSDFENTASYTPKIKQYSKYYHTFSNVITFRTVTGEYLIAMKLMAGRQYKYDLSDIIGILLAHEKAENPLTLETIKQAVCNLYGSYEALPVNSRTFIEQALMKQNYASLYLQVREEEQLNKAILLDFQDKYPNITNQDNVNDIIETIKKRQNSK